jgi:hypothetical protein
MSNIKNTRYLVRPICYDALHHVQGHDDYTGDIDCIHIDHTIKAAFIIDIKYGPMYNGTLKPLIKKSYEQLANAMSAGGLRTYVIIAEHDVDVDTEGAMVPIERCLATSIYYANEAKAWINHKALPLHYGKHQSDMKLPLLLSKFKAGGQKLEHWITVELEKKKVA